MAKLDPEILSDYRKNTFSLKPWRRLRSQNDAIEFVNRRGFIFFWPIKDITLPSLWVAAAGNRPVADRHDDPGHVTWGWKDGLLGKRRWYYAKVLRKKATMISLEMAPFFYALSDNYGSPEEDYLTLYEQGRLTQEAKIVYETLLREGPMDTIALRRATRFSSRDSDTRFNRAITDLQADFKILPIGVAKAGGWNYAFIYEMTARHYPSLPDEAHSISERSARAMILEKYFESVGAVRVGEILKLFRWESHAIEKVLNGLVESGFLRRGLEMNNDPVEWIALTELAS
jgi:hypothetical protein